MPSQPPYWFPAKRYGWGWGLPVAWQGWVVLAVFALLVAAGAFCLLPRYAPWVFIAYVMLSCLLFVAVCWLKGESPRWRWRGR